MSITSIHPYCLYGTYNLLVGGWADSTTTTTKKKKHTFFSHFAKVYFVPTRLIYLFSWHLLLAFICTHNKHKGVIRQNTHNKCEKYMTKKQNLKSKKTKEPKGKIQNTKPN